MQWNFLKFCFDPKQTVIFQVAFNFDSEIPMKVLSILNRVAFTGLLTVFRIKCVFFLKIHSLGRK